MKHIPEQMAGGEWLIQVVSEEKGLQYIEFNIGSSLQPQERGTRELTRDFGE